MEGIINNGLIPKIGKNSKGIELNPKVFFAKGEKGVIVLMDAWIKWIVLRPSNDFVYHCGAYFMKQKYFPKIIIDIIFNSWINRQKRILKAINNLKQILDNSVFLILELEENIDFDYNDIDEVKNQKFTRDQLKYIYTYESNVEDSKMEYWNMHTLPNKTIEPTKISLLQNKNDFKASTIVKDLIEKNKQYVETNCPFLCKYYTKLY